MKDAKTVLLESLSKIFPSSDEGKKGMATVTEAIEAFVKAQNEVVETLKSEHAAEIEKAQQDINEQFAVASKMIFETEQAALQGYEEAAALIDQIKAEYEQQISELIENAKKEIEAGFEEAAKKIDEANSDVERIERELAIEYDNRIEAQRLSLLELMDSFLVTQGSKITNKIYEQVIKSPELAAEANALRRIRAIVGAVPLDEEATAAATAAPAAATEGKNKPAVVGCDECSDELDRVKSEVTQLQASLRASEARNVRLNVESTRNKTALDELNKKYEALLSEVAKTGQETQEPQAPLAENANGDATATQTTEATAAENEANYGRGRVVGISDLYAEASGSDPEVGRVTSEAADDDEFIPELGMRRSQLKQMNEAQHRAAAKKQRK